MKFLPFVAAILAAGPILPLTVSDTGINGDALSGGVVSSVIDMDSKIETNQIAWTVAVTAGTTTRVHVTCEESQDNSTWGYVPLCDGALPTASCSPDTREYTLTDGATFSTRWAFAQRYVRCTFEDPDAGTGTVIVTGSRSAQ